MSPKRNLFDAGKAQDSATGTLSRRRISIQAKSGLNGPAAETSAFWPKQPGFRTLAIK